MNSEITYFYELKSKLGVSQSVGLIRANDQKSAGAFEAPHAGFQVITTGN